MLCEQGGISFPDAWKLLREARLPRPQQELPRAAWIALLGHAHAAAQQHPEQAAAHLHTLWEAAKDPSARVCAPGLNTHASISSQIRHSPYAQCGGGFPEVCSFSVLQLLWSHCKSGNANAACSTRRAMSMLRAGHDLMWAAAQVRAAAYSALACWTFDLLELLELERPLSEYSGLLLEETDVTALAACEALVVRALSYEHARRRR